MARIQQHRTGKRPKREPVESATFKQSCQASLTSRGFPPKRWGECLHKPKAPPEPQS